MNKRLLSALLSLCMIVTMIPVAFAEGEDKVAKIGETEYATLDEAVKAAQDGDTIELLADCTTEGLNLSKNITIQKAESVTANPTVTFTKYGIALWGKALTFKYCNVVMNGIGSTPYTAEWNWQTICASKNASLSLDHATMTMDGDPNKTGENLNKHAIYFCSNNKLNLTDSTLTIRNYTQDALEWDGGDGGYNVNITNSTFISDHNRSGFTGTFYATIDNSTVKVINSLGNGSNGTYYTIKNNSNVLFDGNGAWGISAWRIDMTNYSTLTATNNGYSGVWTRVLNVDKTCTLDVEKNGTKALSADKNPGIFFQGNGSHTSTIEKGAKVTIQNNAGSGIYTKQKVCNLTIGSATITNNGNGAVNQKSVGADKGGGVYNVGTMVLDKDVVLYNNHAETAGDDIYNTGTITFGKVGTDWALDGAPDCTDAIDGWYIDELNQENGTKRWSAHKKPVYTELFNDFEDGIATVSDTIALKAAHGLMPVDPSDPDAQEWTISKSKTATNLEKQSDGTYTSDVTLSLPSSQEQLTSDVVFVLDKSTSSVLEDQALGMLSDLKTKIETTDAKVKVGVVIFNKQANVTELTDLATGYDTIEKAIKEEIKSGTNTHAGLLAGKKLLDEDTSVASNRKYLIFVSDGITYMYNEKPTATAWSFFADAWKNWAGPDNWKSKYDSTAAPSDWANWLKDIGTKVEAQGTIYEYPYDETPTTETPHENWQTAYANSIDKALYLTHEVYQAAANTGYHCYAMTADSDFAVAHPWASSFISYLADGKQVSFDAIENDIYYLLDAGSKVTDVIGYGKDNRDNDYNFDFVNAKDQLVLTVNGEKQAVTDLTEPASFFSDHNETARYGFGESSENIPGGYPYVLHYYAKGQDGKSDECFVWDINVPVSNFAPVQLTYTVKLTNPQEMNGIYGVYDADGDGKDAEGNRLTDNTSLYTNKQATLHPVDSNQEAGIPENFNKPTVSYTISSSGGGHSGGGGGGSTPSTPSDLDTVNHYAYIIGRDDGLVHPEAEITRAEVATIFFRLLTDDSRSANWAQTNHYSDVSADRWFNHAISTLSKMGIINGYTNGTFKPDQSITRAEFVKMAVGFFHYTYDGNDSFFSDIDGNWAEEYIKAAADIGLINGYTDGTFRPNNNITRAEAVTIVNNTIGRKPVAGKLLSDKEMIMWPDNQNTAKWYYAGMQEATNSHDYTWNTDKTEETWTKELPIRDWAALEREWADNNASHNPGDVISNQ